MKQTVSEENDNTNENNARTEKHAVHNNQADSSLTQENKENGPKPQNDDQGTQKEPGGNQFFPAVSDVFRTDGYLSDTDSEDRVPGFSSRNKKHDVWKYATRSGKLSLLIAFHFRNDQRLGRNQIRLDLGSLSLLGELCYLIFS